MQPSGDHSFALLAIAMARNTDKLVRLKEQLLHDTTFGLQQANQRLPNFLIYLTQPSSSVKWQL
jgi:hypothetical protein